jgi:hypothetical protein
MEEEPGTSSEVGQHQELKSLGFGVTVPPHETYCLWDGVVCYLVLLSYKDTTCGKRGGLAHGVGGCGSAFPLPAAVADLAALAGDWEEERGWSVALRLMLFGRVSSSS